MRKYLTVMGLVFALFLLPTRVHGATTSIVWETTADTVAKYFGSNTAGLDSQIAESLVMPTSTIACNVTAKIYYLNSVPKTSTSTLRIYQMTSAGASYPTDGTLLATIGVKDTLVQVDTGSYTTYQSYVISPCMNLYKGFAYSFIWSRQTETNQQPYIGRVRTTDQFSYSSYWSYNNGSGWVKDPVGGARDIIMRIYGFNGPDAVNYGFTNKDFGLLGNMFRDVGMFLFVPDNSKWDEWKAKGTNMAIRVPFGYMGLAYGYFNQMPTTSAPFLLEVKWTDTMPTSTIDIGASIDAVPSKTSDLSKTAVKYMVWISVLAYVVQRAMFFRETPPV